MKVSPKTVLLGALVGLPLLVGGYWLLATLCTATGYPLPWPRGDREQPVNYSHKRHLALGIECAACHIGAETGTHAGIPTANFCATCHHVQAPSATQTSAGTASQSNTPPAQAAAANVWAAPTPPALARYLEKGREIPWKQFQRVPRHVYFSHRRHVTIAKLDCAACHGDMRQRDTPVTHPVFPTHLPGMNRCVNCHLKEKVSTDCIACHH